MAESFNELNQKLASIAAGKTITALEQKLKRLGIDINGTVAIAATQTGSFAQPILNEDGTEVDRWVAGDVMGSKPC